MSDNKVLQWSENIGVKSVNNDLRMANSIQNWLKASAVAFYEVAIGNSVPCCEKCLEKQVM